MVYQRLSILPGGFLQLLEYRYAHWKINIAISFFASTALADSLN